MPGKLRAVGGRLPIQGKRAHPALGIAHAAKPPDMAATILHALGIDPATTLHTPLGRPLELAGGGKPVRELFGT